MGAGREAARGRRRGGVGEERERGRGEGSSPRGSKLRRSPSLRPRAPRGERERGGREVAAREKSNERKRPGEGGAHGEGTGARGAQAEVRPSWARLGWAAPRVKTPWHTQPQIGKSIRKTETETKLSNACD
jgi:hypothetical protein